MTDANASNPPKSPALDIRNFEKEIAGAVSDMNKSYVPRKALQQLKPNEPPEYRFMQLTEANCEAMLEAARQQLTIAQNNMKETEAYVDQMRQESRRRWDEHESYVKALEDFGHRMLDANETFRKANGKR